MFINAGKKIKIVARVLFYVFSALALIFCFWNLIESDIKALRIAAPILTIFFIAFMWIVCLLVYGFGELIEDNRRMRFILEKEKKEPPSYTFEDDEENSFLEDLVRTKETDELYNPVKEEQNEDE